MTSEATPALTTTLPPVHDRGTGIMLSYRELVEIRTQQATMLGKLDAALMLSGRVDHIDKRLGQVEIALAGKVAAAGARTAILSYMGGLVTAAIGGGAAYILPKLWGG